MALWNVQKGKRDQTLNHLLESLGKGRQNGVTEAQFCNKNKSIVTGCGACIRESETVTIDTTFSLEVGKTSGVYDSTALIWDMQTGKVIHVLKGYPFDVSPDGGRIVSGSVNTSGNNASVWDVTTGNLVLSLSGHTGKVTSVQYSRNGKWIFTASAQDGTCRIWDGITGKFICYLNAGPGNPGSTYQLSPDGKMISSFSQDTVRIWNVAEGRLMHSIYANRPPTFSNDSRQMLIFNGRKAVALETVSGKPVMVEKKPVTNSKKKVLKVIN
jgi:WD40 repeat protein